MATAVQKIHLVALARHSFNKLVLAQTNVRRIKAGVSIEELASSIARRGLIQSIHVRPVLDATGEETGMFEVPAGGRRYRALEVLVKQKRLAKTAPVPCVVGNSSGAVLAEEVSLAENIEHAPMYSPNRTKQIEFVTQHLKEGGIFVFVEKFQAAEVKDYQRREDQKDFGFKARYFSHDEIEGKKNAVLRTMFNNEVTLDEMSRA